MRGFYNTDYYWENGAKDIKAAIGTHIDAVFCGSDYSGTNRFESLYCPESEVIYFDRREVPISSTEIRFDPYKQWDYLPPVCRPYYAKRVLIVGGESTGKSTPVQNLALAYNTNYVSEVGRETCEAAGGEAFMNMDDLEVMQPRAITDSRYGSLLQNQQATQRQKRATEMFRLIAEIFEIEGEYLWPGKLSEAF